MVQDQDCRISVSSGDRDRGLEDYQTDNDTLFVHCITAIFHFVDLYRPYVILIVIHRGVDFHPDFGSGPNHFLRSVGSNFSGPDQVVKMKSS